MGVESVTKAETDCRDACSKTYSNDKVQYERCIKYKCGVLTSKSIQESGKETKKLVIEPQKKLADTKLVKVENKNVRIKETKKGVIIKESVSNSIGAKSNITVKYEDGKLVSGKSKKQIKVLPSDIRQKVIGIQNIKLADEESPKYFVKSKNKGKLLGTIPVNINRDYEINAETGETLRVNAPWWTRFTAQISLPAEGQSCSLFESGKGGIRRARSACDEGLRCESVNEGAKTGVCRVYPPVLHGRIVYEWNSWDDFEQWFTENWPEIPLSEARSWAFETDEGIEVSFIKWLEWAERANGPISINIYFLPRAFGEDSLEIDSNFADDRGNFRGNLLQSSKYQVAWQTISADGERTTPNLWEISTNGGPETFELNLCGSAFNDYNKIQMVTSTQALAIPPAPPIMGPPANPCD